MLVDCQWLAFNNNKSSKLISRPYSKVLVYNLFYSMENGHNVTWAALPVMPAKCRSQNVTFYWFKMEIIDRNMCISRRHWFDQNYKLFMLPATHMHRTIHFELKGRGPKHDDLMTTCTTKNENRQFIRTWQISTIYTARASAYRFAIRKYNNFSQIFSLESRWNGKFDAT